MRHSPDAPTIPAPPRVPTTMADAPTPIPRKSDLEELRSLPPGVEPSAALLAAAVIERLDQVEAGVLEALARQARHEVSSSQTDLAQDARTAALAGRITALEEAARAGGAAALEARDASTALDKRLSGWASPRVIGALAGGVALVEFGARVLHALGVMP